MQPRRELLDERAQSRHRQRRGSGRGVLLEQRDETRHVRALLLGGQRYVDVAGGDRRVHGAVAVGERQRIAQALDADAIDRKAPLVAARLHVGDRYQPAGRLGSVHGVKFAIRTDAGRARATEPPGASRRRRRSEAARPHRPIGCTGRASRFTPPASPMHRACAARSARGSRR